MKTLQYSTYVTKKNDKYIVYSPELSIFTPNNSLQKAYEGFNLQKNSHAKFLIENELYSNVIKKENKSFLSSECQSLVKKTSALCISIFVLFLITLFSFNTFFNQVIDHELLRMENRIKNTLNPSQNKKEERFIRFQKKIKNLKPYLQETKELIIDH